MKLQFGDSSQEEDDKPSCLTLDFFSSLMAVQAKRKGIFQILSFTKKRQRVYSTRLNDGYFSLKVMVVNDAALQIESGLIKQFYLLEGNLRNHGEGVIVMKEEVKCWKYGAEVGSPVAWRLKKENVNYKGSNFVVWSTQKKEQERLSSSQIVLDYGVGDSENQSEKTASPVKHTPIKKQKSKSQEKERNQIGQISDIEKKGQKSLKLSQTDCIDSAPQTKSFTQPQKAITPLKQSNQQRFQSIMKLFFNDESSDEEPPPVIQPPKQAEVKPTTSSKKLMERKEDLQFIFNFLGDSEDEKVEETKEINCVLPQGILDSTQKKCQRSSSSDNDYDLTEWISKKMSKSKEDLPDSKSKINVKQEEEKLLTFKPQTSFSDLSQGFVAKSWEVTAVVKCLIQHNSHTFCIICDQNHQYLINTIFSNTAQHPQLLQQGYLYRLGGGTIRQSPDQNLNLSNVDIQFNCNTSLIKQLQRDHQEAIQPSSNYTQLQKVYDLQEGYMINCFGILKDVRIIPKGKNVTVHLEIADPITKWTVLIVQFNAKGNNEGLKDYIGRFLTIYGGCIGPYKNKKNIVKKPNTIIRHDFLPLTKEAREVREWLEANNSLKSLETQLIGYTEISDLRGTEEQSGVNFYLNKVVVFSFNSQLTYTACRICLKKVREGRCFTCGVKRPNQIQERLFLRGEIGDSTTSASVIWANSTAQNMLVDGFEEMKNRWLLRSVSVWIDKGHGGSLSIVRMKMRECKQQLQVKINEIRANLLQGT